MVTVWIDVTPGQNGVRTEWALRTNLPHNLVVAVPELTSGGFDTVLTGLSFPYGAERQGLLNHRPVLCDTKQGSLDNLLNPAKCSKESLIFSIIQTLFYLRDEMKFGTMGA